MTAKEFRISELNRILPMVLDTIVKEHRLELLTARWQKLGDDYRSVTKQIDKLSSLLDEFEDSSGISFQEEIEVIQKILSKLEQTSSTLEQSIDTCKDEISILREQSILERRFYEAVVSSLFIPDGFVSTEEINKNYLSSYIYLLSLTDGFGHHAITMSNLFEGEEGVKAFLDLIHATYTPEYVQKILAAISYK